MEKRIVEKYKFNQITMEIEETSYGYNVIYRGFNKSDYLLKEVSLCAAYSFIAGYLYSLIEINENRDNYGNGNPNRN